MHVETLDAFGCFPAPGYPFCPNISSKFLALHTEYLQHQLEECAQRSSQSISCQLHNITMSRPVQLKTVGWGPADTESPWSHCLLFPGPQP